MTQVPKDFQDYDDDDSKLDLRKARWKYWDTLRLLRAEYGNMTGTSTYDGFYKFLSDTYGFRPILNADHQITDEFEITDEKKYLIYLLKYG
jgi:hypothetical protein